MWVQKLAKLEVLSRDKTAITSFTALSADGTYTAVQDRYNAAASLIS
jgi:hypothetical protein